jgi:hypothetical protein
MRLLILLTFMALTAPVLSGCAQNCPPPPAPRIVDTACAWVTPMTAASADTSETKREIIAYELARQKNCPGTAP